MNLTVRAMRQQIMQAVVTHNVVLADTYLDQLIGYFQHELEKVSSNEPVSR